MSHCGKQEKEYAILTPKTQNALPYMIKTNWLVCYQSLEGLELILFQMDYRTKNRVNMPAAMEDIQAFYAEIEHEFLAFFKALQYQTKLELDTLRNEFCYYN